MAKYKLKNQQGYNKKCFTKGEVYDGNYRAEYGAATVNKLVNTFPHDWELVEESIDKEDVVNHPKHYKKYPVETIDMMEAIWGKEKVAIYCLLNAFKYRMRMGMKDDIKQDMAKEEWYLNKYKELTK